MKKRLIISAIVIVLLIIVGSQTLFKKSESEFETFEVIKGTVVQEVSETGQVKKGDKINLGFKNSGEIEKIYVKVGENVYRGAILAKLDASGLYIQLDEASAGLAISQAKLDKLLAGATQEELQDAQTTVSNAETSLADTRAQADDDLDAAYEDARNTLNDAYLKAYNAQNKVDSIQRSYFTSNDQEGTRVKTNKTTIESAVSEIRTTIDDSNIDDALLQTKDELSKIANALKVIRETCEEPTYRNTVSSADKTALDTHRTNINDVSTDISNAQQTISSAKLTNEDDINTAEGTLQAAKDDLALLEADPRQEDIDLNQAQVDRDHASVNKLEDQIQDAILRAPVEGQVAEIKKKVGELAQQDTIATLIPTDPFEIEVDIYEEDIVKVEIDNPVDISLVAFPNQIFKGKVISIDPAEKIVDGVVYYEISIAFEEMPENIKSGMTADITIRTVSKENVLVISEDAVIKNNDKVMVQVLKDNKAEEKEIVIGLEGSNDLVEVISGLEEGEIVILQ